MSESSIQARCFKWHHNEFPKKRGRLFHVPNGGKRSKQEAAKFQAMGVWPGVADFTLLHNQTAFFIEMKDEHGSQSEAQKKWQAVVENAGFRYYLCDSEAQFKDIIQKVYRIKPKVESVEIKRLRLLNALTIIVIPVLGDKEKLKTQKEAIRGLVLELMELYHINERKMLKTGSFDALFLKLLMNEKGYIETCNQILALL